MATTYQDTTGNGSNKVFNFSFPYLLDADVKVEINQVQIATTEYAVSTSPTKITFNNNSINSAVQESDGAPKNGLVVRVYRDTARDAAKAIYAAGSTIKAANLNDNQDQVLYATQEEQNQPISKWKIRADSIDGTKIADDSIDSEHLVDGSIDTAHIADNQVTAAKLTSDSVTTAKITDANVTTAKIADSNITTAKIADTNVTTAKIADSAVTSAKIAAGTIATADLADDAVTSAKIADDSVDGDRLTDNITIAGTLGVTGASTLASVTGSAVVTSGTSSSDTQVYSAKRVGEIFYGKDTTEEIQSGETWSAANDKVATTAAIDARIIDLVDDVGGFVPIANETSFPDANPDVNNGAGTLISVKSLASALTSNGSGVATIANGNASSDATITINGLANSTTYAAGFGLIVETTTTLHTYTFHRQVPKATEVTTVASNISNVNTVAGISSNVTTVAGISSNVTTVAGVSSNVTAVAGSIANVNTTASNLSSVNNFGSLYQIASSNPSTDGGGASLAAGDLYFNTSANELKVYNGSAWQGGVTASGSFAAVTGNTWTGDNKYNDNVNAHFGTGSDTSIYHNDTDFYVDNDKGDIKIRANVAGDVGGNILLMPHDDEDGIKIIHDGNVELYANNAKKLEITSSGATLTGTLIADNLDIGTDVDIDGTLEADAITVDGTALNTVIAGVTVTTATNANHVSVADNESTNENNLIPFIEDASATGNVGLESDGDFHYNPSTGSVTATTFIGNVTGNVTGNTSGTAATVTGAAQSSITSVGTLTALTVSGDVTLDNGTNAGNDLTWDASADSLIFDDNVKAAFGDGSDLKIYHDGTNSYIDNVTGGVFIRTNNTEDAIKCLANAQVELYYDTSKKLETVTGGVNVTGTLTASTDVTVSSDERLKEDVKTIDNALDKVDQLRGVEFTRIEGGERQIGVIAQEVEKVIPEVVKDGAFKSVSYGNLVGLLIEAIKELKAEIKEIKGS